MVHRLRSRLWHWPLALLVIAVLACNFGASTGAATQAANPTSLAQASPTAQSVASATAEPNPATATTIPTKAPTSSPVPTAAKLQLEIVQLQAWTDKDGNVRTNVLLRNPYEFPVAPNGGAGVVLFNKAGERIRFHDLYFLDGISGGNGFLLPGETIAATACFTCEQALLTEAWDKVEVGITIKDATDEWKYSTEVEATVNSVSFDGDSPIFWINGTVKNNSGEALQRISTRVIVFDQEGKLVGAAEASAWDVAAGGTATFDSYGIGQAPDGPTTYEVSALGVNY